jgi:hypothetical protein
MSVLAVVAILIAQTGLVVWLELWNRQGWRRIEAKLEAEHVASVTRFDLFDARLASLIVKKNGGDHVAADHPHLIEKRQ